MAAILGDNLANTLQQLASQNDNNTGLGFTILNNSKSFGVIPIDPSLTNISVFGNSIGPVLSNDTFSVPQRCVYAISGSYGFLNRLLYYCLLLFALLVRQNTWLLPAALGIAMTYSTIASIHAFALLSIYRYEKLDEGNPLRAFSNPRAFGDLDLYGIYPILVSGSVLLMPILNWSSTFKSEKYRNARPVILLWGIIMFAALIPSMLAFTRGFFPFIARSGLSACPVNKAFGCDFNSLFNDGRGVSSSEHYAQCECVTTCGFGNHNNVPMREGSNLQPLLYSHETGGLLKSSSYGELRAANVVFVIIIIIHGVLGALTFSRTQSSQRNNLFSLLVGKKRLEHRQTLSRTRITTAAVIAGSFYLSSLAIAIISPLVFLSSIVINEIQVWKWPAESVQSVGQWGPWVGTAFAVLAAALQRYWESWLLFFFNAVNATIKLFKTKDEADGNADLEPSARDSHLKRDIQAFLAYCSKPFVYIISDLYKSQGRAILELKDFWYWAKDPVTVSTGRPPSVRTDSSTRIEKMETQEDGAGDPQRPQASRVSGDSNIHR